MNLSSEIGESYKKFPYEIQTLDAAINEQLKRDRTQGHAAGFVSVGEEKWILPSGYKNLADELYNFQARYDDVFLCTYPRSGTTMTQEIIWLLCNDLNYEEAKSKQLLARFPFLEGDVMISEELKKLRFAEPGRQPAYEALKKVQGRRLIKTHLPLPLMPHGSIDSKIIYVARNPKDVVVSNYHMNRLNRINEYRNDFKTFVQYFLDDLLVYGSFLKHVSSAWNRRNDRNFLFLFYEDIVTDMPASIKKIAEFLNQPLRDDDLPGILNHMKFDNFKTNSMVNLQPLVESKVFRDTDQGHVRRGKVGGNPEMTEEFSKQIDKWMEEKLNGIDLKFPTHT